MLVTNETSLRRTEETLYRAKFKYYEIFLKVGEKEQRQTIFG